MSNETVATMTAPQSTERTTEIVTAELDAARLAREMATGAIKGNMTRRIKALEAELTALTPETEPVKLVDLEAEIVAAIKAGTLANERDQIAGFGDNVLTSVGIKGYRPDRWNAGRWLSAAICKRIAAATKTEAA